MELTSLDIREPGLRILPPGVERYLISGDDLSIIEISPDDEIEIIRKRYIKLSKEHHPDLLMSKGVPQEVINESKAKMRAINSAWDQVQKLKSN